MAFRCSVVTVSDFSCKKNRKLITKALHTFRRTKEQAISLLEGEKKFGKNSRVLNLAKISLSLKFAKMSTH